MPLLCRNGHGGHAKLLMNSETRQCQNCRQEFRIESEDFEFYEKMKVPPPTFCPKCRLQRRLAFINLINLYRRPCDLCKKETISIYAPDAPYRVYCPPCWWSDNWDFRDYARNYDFSRPFFEQLNELWHEAPHLGLSQDIPTALSAPWNNHVGHLKNCHFLFFADFNEDSAYGAYVFHSNACLDSSLIMSSELCYDSMHSFKNSRCVGLRSQVTESLECTFLKDCQGCQNCFASANLRNKRYYIFNRPYSKDAYFDEIKKWDLGSYRTYQELSHRVEEHWRTLPPKPEFSEFSIDSTSVNVFQSKNCKECYEVLGAEDSKYLFMMQSPPIRDCYDTSGWGNNISLCYEGCVIGENSSGMKFCQEAGINLYNAEYCKLSTGGSDHFGCFSVKKGQYYIFNKPYPKEEYEALRARIIRHMDEMPYVDRQGNTYRYGEFFPPEFSPFAYNETMAQNFFPIIKGKILAKGYQWREPEVRSYTITLTADQLPDHIRDAPDSILQETIGCKKCERGFKIIPFELRFLRDRNLPLPRECPFCRINEKFDLWVKNLRTVPRICDKCGKEFTTRYPKDEAPVVYCKECYLQEIV